MKRNQKTSGSMFALQLPIRVGTTLNQRITDALPHNGLPHHINKWRQQNFRSVLRGLIKPSIAMMLNIIHPYGCLHCTVVRGDGTVEPYGTAGFKLITDAGVEYIVDVWQNLVEFEIMNFHGIGTGSSAASVGETDLVAELTTQYTSDNTRATGTLAEAAANIFRTVGTNPVDATVALREFGLFNNATVASGVMFEREVYAAINLNSGDSLQTTYDVTFTSGG